MTLRELMRLPAPSDTFEQAERYHGIDLQRFSLEELFLERERIRLALLMLDDRPAARKQDVIDWLARRLQLVQARLP